MEAVLFDQGDRFRTLAELGRGMDEVPPLAPGVVVVDVYGVEGTGDLTGADVILHPSEELKALAETLGDAGLKHVKLAEAS